MENTRKEELTSWKMAKRAILCRCPSCGEGKLYKKYLKQVNSCAKCNEEFGHIRADDGPAWLTILITGHILVPIALLIMAKTNWPDWVHMIIWPIATIAMSLALLPSAKGLFISIIWRSGCVGAEKD